MEYALKDDAKKYSVYFYFPDDGEPFSFYSAWTRFRIYGSDEWKMMDEFDFEELRVSLEPDHQLFLQVETVVAYRRDDEEELESWQQSDVSPDRTATITIALHLCTAVRQIYWNADEEQPPFRQRET